MKICVKCGARVEEKDVRTRPVMSKERFAELNKFCKQAGLKPRRRPTGTVEYHRKTEIQGERRKGVIGGFRPVDVECGPLREQTEDEKSADKTLAQWQGVIPSL